MGRCPRCQTAAGGPEPCAACRAHPSPLEFCVAAAPFAEPLVDWIHRFKYPRTGLAGLDPAPGSVLRMLVREAAAQIPGPPPDLVVPVPLHPRRLRQRGFNPAERLARAAAAALGAPLAPTGLRRVRDTESQTGKGRAERGRNVRGAFEARSSPPRVLLVDDVVTTGSTLGAAAAALRRAGASRVGAVCVARA